MAGITELGTVSKLMAGISLSAAAGLRVFLPVLALAWLLVRLFRLLRKRRHSPTAPST